MLKVKFRFENENCNYTPEQLQDLGYEIENGNYNWCNMQVGDIIYTVSSTRTLYHNFKVKTITEDTIILTDLV